MALSSGCVVAYRRLFAVCCLFFCVSVLSAPQVYSRFTHFNEFYNISSIGTAIAQDRQGFIWLGTQQGLYRFDGGDVTHFKSNPLDTTTLSSDWVTSLMVAHDNSLWVGTRYGGVNRYDPRTETFQRIRLLDNEQVSPVEISAIYQDEDGKIWVASYGKGLFYWQTSTNKMLAMAIPDEIDGVNTLYINDVWVSPDKKVWVASGEAPLRNANVINGGLIRWDAQQQLGRGWQSANSALHSNSISKIKVDNDQRLWFTSFTGGLWYFNVDNDELMPVSGPKKMQRSKLTDLQFDEQGNLWLASYDQGIWYRAADSMQWSHFNYESEVEFGLLSSSVTQLMFDQQNTLWLVSQNGFSMLNKFAQRVRVLPYSHGTPNTLAVANVFGIHARSSDDVWLANREAGVAHFNPSTGLVRRFELPTAVVSGISRAVLADQDVVWVGTDQGLYQLDPIKGRWSLFSLPHNGDISPVIGVLYLDRHNRLWVGTRGNGVYLLDQNRQLLHHYHPEATVYTLPFDTVTSILQSKDGAIWIGSADRGIVRGNSLLQQQQHWRQFEGGDHGLLFNGIQLIYEQQDAVWVRAGNQDHLWVNSNQAPYFEAYFPESSGKDAFITAEKFRLLYRQHWLKEDQSFLQLGKLHGMQESTWIGASDIHDGVVYRGGSQGLDYFPINELPSKQLIPSVNLTRLSLFNQIASAGQYAFLPVSLPYLDALVLNYAQDMFSIRFSVPTFFQQGLEYRYRLEGFDRDWIHTGFNERVATYTRLPPGQYELQVSARIIGGEWQATKGLSVEVLPPWWMTWWFRSLMLGLLVLSIWAWLHYKTQAERLMRLQLRDQVAQRTHELKEKHDALKASNQDLTILQQVSREINASLDLEQVLSRCHKVLSELIDVHVMVIGLDRPTEQEIDFVFWLENGVKVPDFSVATDDLTMPATLCFQRKEEIYISKRDDFFKYFPTIPQPLQGKPMQSVLYIPLLVNQQAVGVFSVQSPATSAYSESQLDLLRTLANTIAIAVVNADTFTRLQQTQQQLVTQEKMASLGGLVAGVAHEINTPLGICVTATSYLQSEYQKINKAVTNKALRQSEFELFLHHLAEGLKILEVNTERAATLVQSFKQVSVDQSNDNLRDIDVLAYIKDVMLSLQPQLKKHRCEFKLECEEAIHWHTDAGALAQIITNLIMNSLRHAFADTVEPKIYLQVAVVNKKLQLNYNDNGRGMDAHSLQRLFEPFYTTDRAQGGSGLGAHIVYNLTTIRLRGQINVHSEPDKGLYYCINLPMDL